MNNYPNTSRREKNKLNTTQYPNTAQIRSKTTFIQYWTSLSTYSTAKQNAHWPGFRAACSWFRRDAA